MAGSKREVYFIAIRMQTGAIRREAPLVGLGDGARGIVLEAMDRVDAQVREWGVTGMVATDQLQALLAGLMRLPALLRAMQEAGHEAEITLDFFEDLGLLPPT